MEFLHPYNAYEAFVSEDYEGHEDMCQPDLTLTIKQIVEYSAQGINLNLNHYFDYDDSEEGSQFPLDYDQFDAMQEVMDVKERLNSPLVDVLSDKDTNERPSPEPVPES